MPSLNIPLHLDAPTVVALDAYREAHRTPSGNIATRAEAVATLLRMALADRSPQGLLVALVERIAAQSELLSRRAEVKP